MSEALEFVDTGAGQIQALHVATGTLGMFVFSKGLDWEFYPVPKVRFTEQQLMELTIKCTDLNGHIEVSDGDSLLSNFDELLINPRTGRDRP